MSAVCREKALRTEGVNQMRKRTSVIMPTTRVGRAVGPACGLRLVGEERPAGLTGPKAEWAGKGGWAESEEERFLN
jgi:hypothetical protein